MGNVPEPHQSPKAEKGRSWNWDASSMDDVLDHGSWSSAARAHAWYDPDAEEHDPPQEKGAYKLPHHAVVDGELKVVWNGVNSAMAVLNGARGGVDIPSSDRQAVYRHLQAHYNQFDESPPSLA